MDLQTVNKIINSTKKKIYLISVLFVVLTIALLATLHGIWFAVAEILLLFLILILLLRAYSIKYILDDLCDPEMFYFVYLGLLKKEPENSEKCRVAELMGDYQTAIELSFGMLNGCKKDIQRMNFLLDILRISFDAGDMEMARATIKKIRNLDISEKLLKKFYDFLNMYSCMLDGNYTEARNVLDKIKEETKNKKLKNIVKYKTFFYDGIISYNLCEYDRAEECFNAVIQNCPKLNIATISKEYLSGEKKENISTDLSSFAKNGNMTKPAKVKIEVWRIVTFVLAVASIIISGFSISNTDNLSSDTIDSAIIIYYGEEFQNYDILLRLTPDKKHIVTVGKTDNNYISVDYLKYDSDYECLNSCRYGIQDIRQTVTDHITVAGYSMTIRYIITMNKEEIPDKYECKIMDNNGETLYFAYRFDNMKHHFFSSSGGIEIYDSNGNKIH